MKKVIVTGCAGFIGSSLSQRLLDEGYQVIGVDCYTDNYDIKLKMRNVQSLLRFTKFSFLQHNILHIDWNELLSDVDYVFHQAAIPGVRTSWGNRFENYVQSNILGTQMMLEAAKTSSIKKFVYASSSSIYGNTSGKTPENTMPRPISPYGVTKLSAEQLCHLYADVYNVPTLSLRYFTVYGPKQRPDMAFHKFIRAILKNQSIQVYGDGKQSRDFTYIDDAVDANLLALQTDAQGIAINIGGNSRVTVNEVVSLIGKLTNRVPRVEYTHRQDGDTTHTWADIQRARELLGYAPKITLAYGLEKEINYIQALYP